MADGYPKRRENNTWRDIGGEVVILDEEGTRVCLLNSTAALIWTLADGTKTIYEIAESVCERFDVGHDEALADVRAFSDQLQEAGLVRVTGVSNEVG
jgi:hypothetical protein